MKCHINIFFSLWFSKISNIDQIFPDNYLCSSHKSGAFITESSCFIIELLDLDLLT
eukprot:TRINITY_DN817_c0_g1_i1.p1 TRINITY_DN817_c0_g1~~TRINITY_DN817_c0_g1_i1.p1  ORF type:complete len:56 (+),score=4.19 TRINITY_DN817_c0_g1_i1:171-338(+)